MKSYIMQRMQSFRFAFKGVVLLYKNTPNAKIHLLLFGLVLIMGGFLNIDRLEWSILLTVSALVFSLEAVNSAIETALDRLHPHRHARIGQAKDLAAGAVLIAAIFAVSVGILIFAPYLLEAVHYLNL